MKKKNKMNPILKKSYKKKQAGRKLEKRFEKWILHYNNQAGILAIKLNIARTRKNIYLEKQAADYLILAKTGTWFIDTKETDETTWKPTKREKHQVEGMQKAKTLGKNAGFLIWFKKQDPAGVNLRFVDVDLAENGAKIDDGVSFEWLTFFGG